MFIIIVASPAAVVKLDYRSQPAGNAPAHMPIPSILSIFAHSWRRYTAWISTLYWELRLKKKAP